MRQPRNSFGIQVVALTIVIDIAMVAVIDTLGPGSSLWWISIPTLLVIAGAYMVVRGIQHLMGESDTLVANAETEDGGPRHPDT